MYRFCICTAVVVASRLGLSLRWRVATCNSLLSAGCVLCLAAFNMRLILMASMMVSGGDDRPSQRAKLLYEAQQTIVSDR